MDIARIIGLIALFTQVMCWFCNIVILFLKPHKWCELLMFAQLVWYVLGIVSFEYFYPQAEVQWCLVIYGYPILLLPIQLFAYHQFLLLYKERKQENEKFLYVKKQTIKRQIKSY